MIERKALIFNIQKYNMYDGPGVRTIVFFKGCPLRCKWCSNPEGQSRRYDVLYKESNCVRCGACIEVCPAAVHSLSPTGEHVVDRHAECIGCRKCEEVCPASALAITGETRCISDLVSVVEEDMPFYNTSGGGLTIGGGEVLMQPEAAANLLMACKRKGINTAIETSGYARPEALMQVAEFTDLFLYDIKHIDSEEHYSLTGVRNETILSNVKLLLEHRHSVKIRVPLLKGLNDSDDAITRMLRFLEPYRSRKNFKGVDLLPYHKMGVNKYKQLGKEYLIEGDPSLSEADLERLEACVRRSDFPVSIIKH